MSFPYINVDYDFDGTSVISLKDQTFSFDDVTLKDKAHHTSGRLTGTLKHSFFDNWTLDLVVNTNNLLVLNTVEKENSVYYGTGFLEGVATIQGRTDKLVIDVNGKTKKKTHFVIPISDVKTVEELDKNGFSVLKAKDVISGKEDIDKHKAKKCSQKHSKENSFANIPVANETLFKNSHERKCQHIDKSQKSKIVLVGQEIMFRKG